MKNPKFSILFPCKNCLKIQIQLKISAAAAEEEFFLPRHDSFEGSLNAEILLPAAAVAVCLPRHWALCTPVFWLFSLTVAAEALCLPRQ